MRCSYKTSILWRRTATVSLCLSFHICFLSQTKLGKSRCTHTVYHPVNEINACAPTLGEAQLSPLLTVIQRNLNTQSHSIRILNSNQPCQGGLRGLTPASDVLRLQGRVGALAPSVVNGHPLQRLMTSTGSRPPVLLYSCCMCLIDKTPH